MLAQLHCIYCSITHERDARLAERGVGHGEALGTNIVPLSGCHLHRFVGAIYSTRRWLHSFASMPNEIGLVWAAVGKAVGHRSEALVNHPCSVQVRG